MTNLIDAAVLPDPLVSEHPTVEEESDWRDRGSKSELRQDLWHGDDGDFGAMTRFGMGWGPLEVRRANRYHSAIYEGQLVRVLDLVVAGEPRYRITVRDEGGRVRITDQRTGTELVSEAALRDAGATRTFEGGRYATHLGGREVEDVSRLDHYEPAPAPAAEEAPGTGVDPAVVDQLRQLAADVQDVLTPARREKRYLPRSAMDAIDEITTLIGGEVRGRVDE